MKLMLREIPLSKNKYITLHWSKRMKYKECMMWMMYIEKINVNVTQTEESYKLPYKKATITFDIFFKKKRKRDVSNYLGGGLIAWLDALVDSHFIADDSYECIGQPNITFNIDKDNPRCEIIIEEVK